MGKKAWYKLFAIIGIALCGLCCALPIVGTVIGMASTTAFSFYMEKTGILALGLAGVLFWYNWYSKRRKLKSCKTDCNCKIETVSQNNLS